MNGIAIGCTFYTDSGRFTLVCGCDLQVPHVAWICFDMISFQLLCFPGNMPQSYFLWYLDSRRQLFIVIDRTLEVSVTHKCWFICSCPLSQLFLTEYLSGKEFRSIWDHNVCLSESLPKEQNNMMSPNVGFGSKNQESIPAFSLSARNLRREKMGGRIKCKPCLIVFKETFPGVFVAVM